MSQPLKFAEQMPRFRHADCPESYSMESQWCANKAMLELVYQHLEYPEAARANGTEGTVVISFTVTKTGQAEDFRILRDPGDGLGAEALRVARKQLTDWYPGVHEGKIVDVQFPLPVKFQLEQAAPAT